jgi:hypothetical protein
MGGLMALVALFLFWNDMKLLEVAITKDEKEKGHNLV